MGAPACPGVPWGLAFETWDPSHQFPLETPTFLFVIRSRPGNLRSALPRTMSIRPLATKIPGMHRMPGIRTASIVMFSLH
jgi:hypothetical protein